MTPMIFFLCHLEFSSMTLQNGYTEMYAVRTVQICDTLEKVKGAHASSAMRYDLNNYYSMMNYQAICGGPLYLKCPLYRGN